VGRAAARRSTVSFVNGPDNRGSTAETTIDGIVGRRQVDEERQRCGRPGQTAGVRRRRRRKTFNIVVRHHPADQDEDQKASDSSGRVRATPTEDAIGGRSVLRTVHAALGDGPVTTSGADPGEKTAVSHHRVVTPGRVLQVHGRRPVGLQRRVPTAPGPRPQGRPDRPETTAPATAAPTTTGGGGRTRPSTVATAATAAVVVVARLRPRAQRQRTVFVHGHIVAHHRPPTGRHGGGS